MTFPIHTLLLHVAAHAFALSALLGISSFMHDFSNSHPTSSRSRTCLCTPQGHQSLDCMPSSSSTACNPYRSRCSHRTLSKAWHTHCKTLHWREQLQQSWFEHHKCLGGA